ncbi:hypothetical protein BI347_00375 [Chromobacterium sphagni]|uniref:Uncharacterized protein n=1 Tax=Chromobacterium sphagni TaxID=1903179 RepID=A0A1S1WYH7_9NEIS|nr:hypothetical protein BI347_00375 [Chromobacterium sphagni]OHX21798.1 hypothetical protein BI344_04640 [Chromobacterium sphagni]
MLGLLLSAAGGALAAPITNFDSDPVIDLAGQLRGQQHGARAIAVQTLDAAASAKILREVGDRRQLLDPMGIPEDDKRMIAAHPELSQRQGKLLTVSTPAGQRLQFKSWKVAKGDGDSSTFLYQGPLAGNALQRVDLQFGHDAPGSLLIDNRSGKVFFTYSTENMVAPSPDGSALLQLQSSPDWRLQLVSLPQTEQASLFCSLKDASAESTFKSWRGNSLGLQLEKGGQKLALRFTRNGGDWQVASSQPALLAKLGFRCSQPR